MTEAHPHHWLISSPVSVDDGPPTTSWHCRTCGEVRTNVQDWKMPNQFFLADRFKKQLKEMEGLE